MTDIHQVWIGGKPQLGRHELACHAYNRKFPDRPPLSYGGKNPMVTGAWMIGACYKNPNDLYGAYPHGYLERIHVMFPDARRILHVFSGGLTLRNAMEVAGWDNMVKVFDVIEESTGRAPTHMAAGEIGVLMELVDTHGPDQGRYPTWQGDVLAMPEEWEGRFDLVLADPPYSAEDAKKYDCPPPNRGKIMRALRRVAAPGANLVYLDVVWPMHRKTDWKTWGTILLLRSTNHRARAVTMFQAVTPNEKEKADPPTEEAQ
jgi:hypothetical protein